MRKCECEDWENYIEVVCDWALAFQMKFRYSDLDFKAFRYCPWCGKELLEGIEHGVNLVQ